MVTVVTVFLRVVAIPKIPSLSTRPTRSGRKVKGGIPAGGDCRKAIQPEPLDAAPRTTLAGGGKATPFLLPNGE